MFTEPTPGVLTCRVTSTHRVLIGEGEEKEEEGRNTGIIQSQLPLNDTNYVMNMDLCCQTKYGVPEVHITRHTKTNHNTE